MVNLIHAVDSLAKVFASLKNSIGNVIVGRVERSLDEYLEVSGNSKLIEAYGNGIAYVWSRLGGFNGTVGYIDSSSRTIGFNPSRIIVSGLVASVSGVLRLSPNPTGGWTTRFLGVKSIRQVLERIEEESLDFIAVKSPVGEYYDVDYKDDNIGDELRLELENHALEQLVRKGQVEVIVVDGPVYHTPQILFRGDWKNNKYARAFHKLLEYRVRVLKESSIPVIGFVKRVEYSRKLARCSEVREVFRERLGREPSPNTTDPLIVEYLAEELVRPQLMQPVVIGPLLLEYSKTPRGLEDVFPSKVYWYIARRTPRGYQVARIEVLREHWDKWKDTILGVLSLLIGSLSLRGVPAGLEVVDKASRKLTALLYMLLYQKLAGVISLAYDEYARVSEVYRELGE